MSRLGNWRPAGRLEGDSVRPCRPGGPVRRSRRPLAGLVAAVLAAVGALVVVPLPASAAARAFEPLYIDEMNGDVMMRGNTLLTCPAADVGSTGVPCAAAQAGDGRNEHFAMTYVDIDGDPGTFSSSSATVTLPPGATVKYAVLTWGAVTVAGSGGSAPRNLASRDVVKLKVPGSSDYQAVQAGLLDSINAIYQGVADVTDAVRQAGTGTYTVADVQAGTGNDRYAAWSLTVLYEDRTQPRRHLSILTGFQNSASNLGRVTVPVSEVVTPAQGPFVTRVGVMAYEGDRGLADRISLDATPLGNESNPASDVLNSSITDLGVPVTDRVPAYGNQLGFDIDRFDASGIQLNADATIAMRAAGDSFQAGVVTFATDVSATSLEATKSVADANGGVVRPGDRLDYTIDVTSAKTEAAVASALIDQIPPYSHYVDGSLQIDGVPVTDAVDLDTGQLADGQVTAYLGTGASATDGGQLAAGTSATVTFSVIVVGNAPDGFEISNTADLAYRSEGSLQQLSGASNTVTSTVVDAPVVTTTAVPTALVSADYSFELTAEGGTYPHVWAVTGGALPPGITLEPGSGELYGAPTTTGTYEFTVSVTDANQRTDTEVLTFEVSPVALTSDLSTTRFGDAVTLTASHASSAARGTVTFTALTSTGGASVELGSAEFVGGLAQLTTAMPAFGVTTVTATYPGDQFHPASTSTTAQVDVHGYPGQVLVTEFRTSGLQGVDDSYVEITNTGPDVPLAGMTVTSDEETIATVPADAGILASGRSYLLTGSQYSLSALGTSDLGIDSFGLNGVQVIAPDVRGTVLDGVGPQTGMYDGSPLSSMDSEEPVDHAWLRLQKSGAPVNTVNTAADFALVSTSGGLVGGVQSTIGSPSPTGTTDAFRHNMALPSSLLDVGVGESATPNRVYVRGTPGTLTVRRTITNTSSVPVTEAKVRITALSAANGAPRPGGTTRPPGSEAALRVVQPSTWSDSVALSTGQTATVFNLAPHLPTGGAAGGLNTTLNVPLHRGVLAPGASVHVAFTFAVDKSGYYWFGYDVDALDVTVGS